MTEYKLRGRGVMAPDWAAIINDLLRIGVTTKQMGDVMNQQLTDRMVAHYRAGTQPSYWKGELLVMFWCKHMGKAVEDVPRCEVVRGHSVLRGRLAMERRRAAEEQNREKMGTLDRIAEALKPVQKVVEGKKRGGRRKKAETV